MIISLRKILSVRPEATVSRFLKKMMYFFAVILVVFCGFSEAIPKYETGKAYPEGKWRRSYYDEKQDQNQNQTFAESVAKDRVQRLGFTTGYGGGLNGYPHSGTGISTYSPVKLDIGGVVLGTLVGIGAILIIPKLIHVFSGGYGGYGRSADGELSTISDMLNKIDDILGQNNIDSTSCMQRAVCHYIRSSEVNMKTGAADQVDNLIHTLSENSLVDYMIDGTAVKEALKHGKDTGEKECDLLYPTCPLDTNTAMQILTKLLPKTPQ